MPKIAYSSMNFSPDRLTLVETCNTIITEYQADGLQLTLRQLYYQLVARDVVPNKVQEYKRLGDIISNARLCGLVDWNAIEDRTRNLEVLAHWGSPQEIMEAVGSQFRMDKWVDQAVHPEVWIEKEALSGVFERICRPLDVGYLACRGYTSQSEMWSAAMRFVNHIKNGKSVTILHFGDHDPSGIDMTRDIQDRLNMFVKHHTGREGVTVKRLALNMDQVELYNPPENPAKSTDSRFASYQETFGDSSWELDALNPRTLAEIVKTHVKAVCDKDKWDEIVAEENRNKALLQAAANNWSEVDDYLTENFPDEVGSTPEEDEDGGSED